MPKFIRSGYTVEELIKALQKYPKDAKVILSSDEEGNDFGLLGMVDSDDNRPILFPMSGTVETT